MNACEIRPLPEEDRPAAAALLGHLNPDYPAEVLEKRFMTILAEHDHYHPYGAYLDGKLVGLASAWIATKVWCGRYMEVDNIVVHSEHRSAGVGAALMEAMEQLAKERECRLLVLDSYTSNHASHRFYHRLGYEIWGFHFVKPLADLKA